MRAFQYRVRLSPRIQKPRPLMMSRRSGHKWEALTRQTQGIEGATGATAPIGVV